MSVEAMPPPAVALAAVSAALTVWLLVPSGAGVLGRLSDRPHDARELPPWVLGRPGGLPTRTKLLVAALLVGVICVNAGSLGAATLPLGLVGAAGAWVGLGVLETTEAARRNTELVHALPHALDLFAACLEAGLPPRTALLAVTDSLRGPLADDLGYVTSQVAVGATEEQAWRTLIGHPVLGVAARDIARAVETGAPLTSVVAAHAVDARAQRKTAIESAAKAVGVRAVLPLMLCFLPAFMLIGVVPIVAGTLRTLLGS